MAVPSTATEASTVHVEQPIPADSVQQLVEVNVAAPDLQESVEHPALNVEQESQKQSAPQGDLIPQMLMSIQSPGRSTQVSFHNYLNSPHWQLTFLYSYRLTLLHALAPLRLKSQPLHRLPNLNRPIPSHNMPR